MNFNTFSAVTLTLVAFYQPISYAKVDPLVMVYRPNQDVYTITDIQTIRKKVSTDSYSHVVYLCPVEHRIPNYNVTLFEVEEIQSIDSVKEDMGHECSNYGGPLFDWDESESMSRMSYAVKMDYKTKNMFKMKDLDSTKFPIAAERPFSLVSQVHVWRFKYSYQNLTRILSKAHHRMSVHNSGRLPEKCELGVEVANVKQVDNSPYYSADNIEKLIQTFEEWPDENTVFVPHQFVPINDFSDWYSRNATCTSENFVPLLEPVSRVMLKVEQYIQKIASLLPENTLSVATLTHGAWELPLKKSDEIVDEDSTHASSGTEDEDASVDPEADVEHDEVPDPEVDQQQNSQIENDESLVFKEAVNTEVSVPNVNSQIVPSGSADDDASDSSTDLKSVDNVSEEKPELIVPYSELVYMNIEDREIAIPKVLIKIVSYRVPSPIPASEEERKFFSMNNPYKMAIVVHNQTNYQHVERVCGGSRQYCEQNGWYVNEGEEDENVYCCNLSDKMFQEHYNYNEVQNLPFDLKDVVLKKNDEGVVLERKDFSKELESNNGQSP